MTPNKVKTPSAAAKSAHKNLDLFIPARYEKLLGQGNSAFINMLCNYSKILVTQQKMHPELLAKYYGAYDDRIANVQEWVRHLDILFKRIQTSHQKSPNLEKHIPGSEWMILWKSITNDMQRWLWLARKITENDFGLERISRDTLISDLRAISIIIGDVGDPRRLDYLNNPMASFMIGNNCLMTKCADVLKKWPNAWEHYLFGGS